jgi:hydroxypyruvate isomerase
MPRFAANLSMLFGEHEFLDRFAAAAKAGFEAVEYLFPYDFAAGEIATRLKESGLTQVLFNLPPGDWTAGERGLAALPGREEEFRQGVEKALRYAETLDCPRLHAMAGIPPSGQDRESCRATYLENVAWAARMLESEARMLLIEPINTRDMPGYFLSTTAEARRVIEEIGAPNLRLQLDLYHAQIMEGDLAAKLESLFDHIGHIQIAGVPGRHEPDAGEINYPFLFDRLDALGYDGWVGCEYRPKGRTEDGLGWFTRAVSK